jgi:hypothetical protein
VWYLTRIVLFQAAPQIVGEADIKMFAVLGFENVNVFHCCSLRFSQPLFRYERVRLVCIRLRSSSFGVTAFATTGLAEPKLAKPAKAGGARRDRTADLLHAMQALSQLSYGP